MKNNIVLAKVDDYSVLLNIWQTSVLATHDFLLPEDFDQIKQQLIPMYFPAVTLYKACKSQSDEILGFLGVVENKVEMLFIDANARGQGVGSDLLNFAILDLGINELDVNEQNEQALAFYLHHGFKVIARSDVDGAGKPYPTLTLRLPE